MSSLLHFAARHVQAERVGILRSKFIYSRISLYFHVESLTFCSETCWSHAAKYFRQQIPVFICVCLDLFMYLYYLCIHFTWCISQWGVLKLHFTGYRRLIGCLKSQVIFNKWATNYRALLRKMSSLLHFAARRAQVEQAGTLHNKYICLWFLACKNSFYHAFYRVAKTHTMS